MPQISVLLPTYNDEGTIGAAIDSILAQSFGDFELLVIDDGSTDGTGAILAAYSDPRLRVIRNDTNLKIAHALNLGLDAARGDYIARMDADDISLPGRFAAQKAFLDAHPDVGVVGTWIEMFGDVCSTIHRGHADHDAIVAAAFFVNPIAHPTVMMRRSALGAVRYSEFYPRAEDWEFWQRLAVRTRLANLPRVYVRYRIVKGTAKTTAPDANNGKERLLRENLAKLGFAESDFATHLAITDHVVLSQQALCDIENYLLRVLEKNRISALYPEAAFSHEIGHQWFLCCRVAWSSSLPGWQMFKNSPLRKYDSYDRAEIRKLRIRFVAKGILRIMFRPFAFVLRTYRRICRVACRVRDSA